MATAQTDQTNSGPAPTQLQGMPIPASSVIAAASSATPSKQGGAVSSGSPESAPVKSGQEETEVKAPEYGYEVIKQIEKAAEVERAEIKEPKTITPQAPTQTPVTSKPKQDDNKAKSLEKPVLVLPKFSGHKIPEELTNDLENIGKERGKGDPNLARTAIIFFLDRLLKKQALQSVK